MLDTPPWKALPTETTDGAVEKMLRVESTKRSALFHRHDDEVQKMMRKIQSEDLSLEVVHLHAAGIDIGNDSPTQLYPDTRQPAGAALRVHYRETKRQARMAEAVWDSTVAMQSTGVYWIAVYDILGRQASTYTSLVHAIQRICRGGRATCRRANG